MFSGTKATNRDVPSENEYARAAPGISGEGQVHVIIVAIDYKETPNPLTCTTDGRNMERLLAECGIQDVVALYDNQCTKNRVLNAIAEVGQRCEDDDYFVFYYSGHGANVDDEDGDEEDGQDEAFCLVDANGQCNRRTFMTDDEFAEAVINAVDENVRVLILTDCCHSGTIADLDKEDWGGIHAISIAGCLDEQTSGDMGRGGIFTHSMLLAIDKLEDAGQEDYSVGLLYNATVKEDDRVFNSAQDITIQSSRAVEPNEMAWPLIPRGGYQAPLTQAIEQGNGKLDPAQLQQLGVPSAIAGFANVVALPEGIDPDTVMMVGGCLMKVLSEGKKGGCSIM